MSQQLIPADFFGHSVSIVDHEGKRWLTAEELGRCLGYYAGNSSDGVRKLYNRHADEFTEADATRVNLSRVNGRPCEQLIFSATGCIKVSFFANTTTAKQFRAWAAITLENQTPAPVDEPLPDIVRSPRLEASMARMAASVDTMAQQVGTMAEGMSTMSRQLNVTARYIGLLETNQAGKRKITADVARETRALKAEGMNNADIARLLRISATSVSLLVRDKYPVDIPENEAPKTTAGELLESWIEREQAKLTATLQGGA